MNRLEEDFYHALTIAARELAKQMTVMNKLKALELKGRVDLGITPEMIDSIVED